MFLSTGFPQAGGEEAYPLTIMFLSTGFPQAGGEEAYPLTIMFILAIITGADPGVLKGKDPAEFKKKGGRGPTTSICIEYILKKRVSAPELWQKDVSAVAKLTPFSGVRTKHSYHFVF